MQFATAKHLSTMWKAAKQQFAASALVQSLLNMFRVDDLDSDVFAVTDKESRVLMAIKDDGRAEFPVGTKTKDSEVGGDQSVGGDQTVRGHLLLNNVRLMEGEESGLFYIVDENNYILFEIDGNGKADFAGIPRDVQTALDTLSERISALEN